MLSAIILFKVEDLFFSGLIRFDPTVIVDAFEMNVENGETRR